MVEQSIATAKHESGEASHGAVAQAVGNWAYDNRDFMRNNLLGYLPYQIARSAVACVPYGLGFALVFMGTRKLLPEAGRNVDKWESGLKAALQIGGSFTFYRAFSKSGKAVYEDVFDPDKSRDEVVEATSSIGKTFVDDLKTTVPVEAESVPWGAFTLGYITQLHKPMGAAAVAAAKNNWTALVKHPQSNLLQNSAVNTVAYGTFFEVSDRLANDYKRRKGMIPAEDEKKPGDYEFFTHGMGNLMFKRVLPVAVGISAYTATKRIGYRMSGGCMAMDKGFFTNAWREGAATTFFFTLLSVTEPWGKAYDKFFENLSAKNAKDTPAEKGDAPKADDVDVKENLGRMKPEPEISAGV